MTGSGLGIAAVIGAVPLGIYTWRAIFRPWTKCGRCKGSGRVGTPQRWRPCSRCKGSGRRMTWGAQLVRGKVRLFRRKRWGSK